MINCFANETPDEMLENWVGWLQVRIPAIKKKHNAFWVRQALQGYKDQVEANKQQSMTIDQVCSEFGFRHRTLHNWVSSGKLQKYYQGKRAMFKRHEVIRALRKYQRAAYGSKQNNNG